MKKIYIDSTTDKLKLSQFCIKNSDEFNFELIVSKNVSVDILDDSFQMNVSDSRIVIVLNENSSVNYLIDVDSKLNKKDSNLTSKFLHAFLDGMHSQIDIKFLSSLDGCGQYSLETVQHHRASDTKSNLRIKSVLFDEAKFISRNLIRVDSELSDVSAHESSKGLLLGKDVKFTASPRLEVESDDSLCTHGSAISDLDESQLFYLQTRGFSLSDAKNILISAFLK